MLKQYGCTSTILYLCCLLLLEGGVNIAPLEVRLPTLPYRKEVLDHSGLSWMSRRWPCHLYRGAVLIVFGEYILQVNREEIRACPVF